MKWNVYGYVQGSKYLGEIEADTKEEAEKKAGEIDTWISLCHQCASEIDDPQITEIEVERAGND